MRLVMAPSFQDQEPPENPVRFTAIPARGRGHRRSLAAGVVLVPARLLVLKAPSIGRVIMKLLGLHRSAVQTTLIAVLGLVAVTQNHVLFQDAFGQLGQRACSITLALRA